MVALVARLAAFLGARRLGLRGRCGPRLAPALQNLFRAGAYEFPGGSSHTLEFPQRGIGFRRALHVLSPDPESSLGHNGWTCVTFDSASAVEERACGGRRLGVVLNQPGGPEATALPIAKVTGVEQLEAVVIAATAGGPAPSPDDPTRSVRRGANTLRRDYDRNRLPRRDERRVRRWANTRHAGRRFRRLLYVVD